MAKRMYLKVSLNEHLFNKMAPHGDRFRAEGFEAVETTIEKLAGAVSEGTAYSAQFVGGYRKKENFLASDILSLDFDGGVTIEEMLQKPLVNKHASLLYTTVSHSEEEHRFRIVFVLPRTIECANEMRWATKALSRRLGSDPRSTDAAHYFAGSNGCSPMFLGGSVSATLLNELIEDGRRPSKVNQKLAVTMAQIRSDRPIRNDELIQLANGQTKPFDQIKGKVAVYCPFHMDNKPSAFVAETHSGKFLRCSSCQQTWWANDTRTCQHEFSSFDKAVRDLKASTKRKLPDELVSLEQFMGSIDVSPQNIWLQNDRYLQVPDLMHRGTNEGLFFIKSPKGTGKTTFLESYLKAKPPSASVTLCDAANDTKIIPFNPSPSGPSVLVIGHRKALIGELCQRLGLRSYLECKDSKGFFADQKRMRRIGVCLDSLNMVRGRKYDVIVIDEIEQVLQHFLGNTIGSKRREVFECFAGLIANAKQVIALDADLGWLSFMTLNILKNATALHSRAADGLSCPVRILLNDHPVSDQNLEVYANRNHLIAELEQAVSDGKRVYVAANTKFQVEKLEKALLEIAREQGIDLPMIAITSDNSTTEESQAFIKNIKKRILDYQVVLCSPSLGTGIDITFPENEQKIDCVFGFFENGITNHFDIDQQLSRVRHPKATKVWVSPRCFDYETAFEIVQSDVLNADLFGAVDYGVSSQRPPQQSLAITFLTMATLAAVKDRASVNNLKRNILAAKRAMGWEIVEIGKDETLADLGKEIQKIGKQIAQQEFNDKMMSARTLKQSDYERLRRRVHFENGQLTLGEKFNYWRTALEVFYRETTSFGLLLTDRRGRSRGEIRLYEALREISQQDRPSDEIALPYSRNLHKRTHMSVLPDLHARVMLLHGLLQATPIYRNGQFLSGVEYCQDDLARFAQKAIKLKPYIEGQLGISVRYNAEKRPTQLLGTVLSSVGVTQVSTRQAKVGNSGRIRYYTIPDISLWSLDAICERRAEIDGWKFVRDQYGYEDTLEDVEYLAA